jgi:hypothetical protein
VPSWAVGDTLAPEAAFRGYVNAKYKCPEASLARCRGDPSREA